MPRKAFVQTFNLFHAFLLFFLEPGSINIELTEQPSGSRVSGTTCNNQWQTLNDSVMSIGKEINRIAEHIYGNNMSQEEQQKGLEQIERLNKRFADLVVKTAEKNIDNEFGYFLLTYYPEELINNEQRAREEFYRGRLSES